MVVRCGCVLWLCLCRCVFVLVRLWFCLGLCVCGRVSGCVFVVALFLRLSVCVCDCVFAVVFAVMHLWLCVVVEVRRVTLPSGLAVEVRRVTLPSRAGGRGGGGEDAK